MNKKLENIINLDLLEIKIFNRSDLYQTEKKNFIASNSSTSTSNTSTSNASNSSTSNSSDKFNKLFQIQNKVYEIEQSYELFKSVWKPFFENLIGESYTYYSNDFTRQDFIQTLFYDNKCVGLTCLRYINLDYSFSIDDSWLGIWPFAEIEKVQNKSSLGIVNSYFTVSEEFRKTNVEQKYSISYLLGCVSVMHFLTLNSPMMLGMMRTNRSMHKLGGLWGSSLIKEGIMHNQVPTDLVVFYPDRVKEVMATFPDFIIEMFNQYQAGEKNERHVKIA